MEDIFNTLANITKPCNISVVSGSLLDKSLLFKRAWRTYKAKLKHNCKADFGHELANCYRIARLIGYENYKPSDYELNYHETK